MSLALVNSSIGREVDEFGIGIIEREVDEFSIGSIGREVDEFGL